MLHVGNIANNAYLNAKFLREAGVDCDVLSYDYYDLMATPEWEERALHQRRPRWFVQGPHRPATAYLAARRGGNRLRAEANWRLLAAHRSSRFRRLDTTGLVRARIVGARAKALVRNHVLWRIARVRFGRARAAEMYNTPVLSRAQSASPILDRFRDRFPERLDQLSPADFAPWGDPSFWRRVFEPYDLVQCYATDPVHALLSGFRPYVAYEHGTLRAFTMADDPVHRLTALAYRESDHTFVTNGDCLAYAERLGIPHYSAMVHPVDVAQHERDLGERPSRIRASLGADVVLFCPVRHDWEIKGIDIHLRALPRLVDELPGRVVLVLTRWGQELAASEQLIADSGCEPNVVWVEPLDREGLIEYMKAADVVLDQMALPHFGATAPQALAAGAPVVMSYRPESTAWIVDEPAPILPAFDPDGVVDAVKTALDPRWRVEFREHAREWVHRHHHPDRIVREHCRVYRRLLEDLE